MNPHYKLAIFDLGNVVLKINFEHTYSIWSQALNLDVKVLKSRFGFDSDGEAFERGDITPDEFHQRLCSKIGCSLTYSDFERGWNAIFEEEIEGIESVLRQIKPKLQVVAFSNTNAVHFPVLKDRYASVLEHFHNVFTSHEMRTRKPQPEGFVTLLNTHKVEPHEALFFDDLLPNVEGARQLGIHSHHVVSAQTIPEVLRRVRLLD